jgi:predicted CopG family antitoxin
MFTINKRHKNTNIPISIRFNEEIYTRLKAFKEEHGISFNELVLKCCEYALDNYKEEKND